MNQRQVIVNADDFGQSPGINRGVIEAFERGIVTSASLMVRWGAAAEAAGYARCHPEMSVGLHLDFGEMTWRDEEWVSLYRVVDENDARSVSSEIERQVDLFGQLMGRRPTHIDSHQHVHVREPARTSVLRVADFLAVPVRNLTPSIRYCGCFYGQDDKGRPYPQNISVSGLQALLSELEPGVTELGCHPAAAVDLETMYGAERIAELQTLCDSRARQALTVNGVELRSFADWGTLAVSNA
ncbi:MAG TPA: ChbG/HpnK family deacetylase [Bryobacteraceae bacterium]|nr:ChbG/HpnK family deacetylase [Bryobacteraceae bacterium]